MSIDVAAFEPNEQLADKAPDIEDYNVRKK